MAIESLKQRLAQMPQEQGTDELRAILVAMLDGVQNALSTLTTKLDADATVTDTNYNSLTMAQLNAKIVD